MAKELGAQRVSPARESERAAAAAAGLLDLGLQDDAENKNAQEIRGLSLPVQRASAAPRMRQLSRGSWRPEPDYANPEVRQSDRILHVNGVAELVSVCFKRRLQLCVSFCLTLSANDALIHMITLVLMELSLLAAAGVAFLSPTE